MSYNFIPMRIIIKGEENQDRGFLPQGNYVTINGLDSPLKHCCTLELPFGPCDVMVHTPPPHQKYHVDLVVAENQLYYLTLTLDGSRNIVNAEFGTETITEDPWGLYENDFKSVIRHRPEIEAWRRTHTPAPETPQEYPSTPTRKSGKLFGWGLGIMLFFIAGIVGCYMGEIEMANITAYYIGAVVGLLMLIGGLLR